MMFSSQQTERGRLGRSARLTRRAALAACAWLSACTDTVHTVGQLEDTPSLISAPRAGHEPSGGTSGSASMSGGGAGSSSGATANAGSSAGNAGSGSTVIEPAFDAAVVSDPDVSCEGGAEDAVRERVDLYLIVDRNVTLAVPWAQITDGIARYVDDPEAAGTGVGISWFPAPDASMQTMCDADTYSTPDTTIEPLPGNASAIKRDVPDPLAGFAGSPTSAALAGALTLAASRRNGFTTPQAVVVVTDAVQDFVCFNEPRDLERLALNARNGPAAIPTYVVALTVPELQSVLELLGFAPLNNLDQVANNGGTGSAREVSLNLVSGISAAIANTLLEIQHDAEPCRYEVPASVRDALDAGTADLQTTRLGTISITGQALALPQLGKVADCGQGYYLDDPAAPTWATLCDLTCGAVKSGQRQVQWLTECVK
jgi:hypothetical protein